MYANRDRGVYANRDRELKQFLMRGHPEEIALDKNDVKLRFNNSVEYGLNTCNLMKNPSVTASWEPPDTA